MTPGPLRRLVGGLGLLALAPVAYRLATGALDPVDAALRAVLTLVAVVLIGRLLTAWLRSVASSMEQPGQAPLQQPGQAGAPQATPRADANADQGL